MKLYFETALYGLQVASAFILAGPVLVRAERQKTLSRNPDWVSTNPVFLRDNRLVSIMPLKAASILLSVLLLVAVAATSTVFLFAIHGPLFLLTIIGLGLYYNKKEAGVKAQIPKAIRQRASLVPRSLFRFLSARSLLPLIGIVVAIISINVWRLYSGSINSGRALGNITLICLFLCGCAFGIYNNVHRQSYRTSNDTDIVARKFELRLVMATAYFLTFVSLYHTLGSLRPVPMLPQPPTMIHAWFEKSPFSWYHFFNDLNYRAVDYSATIFLIMLFGWISQSRFYKKILIVDFRNPPNPMEV